MKKLQYMKRMIAAIALFLFCGRVFAQTFPYFPPPGTTYNNSTQTWSGVAGLSSALNNTIVGNYSGATAQPQNLNPLQVASMLSAVLTVDVATTGNIVLSGTQTIDSVAVQVGQFVLVKNQTTASQNGIYVVASGAWSRAANFPGAYVIQQNCAIGVFAKSGANGAGNLYNLSTSGGALTIGTSALTFNLSQHPATNSNAGVVKITAAGVATTVQGTPTTGDCVAFFDSIGSIQDTGAVFLPGYCATYNQTSFHLSMLPGPPGASVGTIDPNSSDHWGRITGLAGATTTTVTFSNSFNGTPACVANDSQAATPVQVSAISASSVTFTFPALTGALYFICFGPT